MTATDTRNLTADALQVAADIRKLSNRLIRQGDRPLAFEVRHIAIRLEELAGHMQDEA